tara:strand:- start:6449 stop:8401 length:1953 start_codon:yes stop_codon:yes gene_type:complete
MLLSLAIFSTFCGPQEASVENTFVIRVVDDEYSPKVINIPIGGTVIWQSDGSNDHNVVGFDGSWQAVSSDYYDYGIITKGDQYEYTFDEPGIYEYYCPFHGTNKKGMVGMVVVGDVSIPEVATDIIDTQNLSKEVLIIGKNESSNNPNIFKTIQSGVDAASAGDLIYIMSGVYNESVTVTTPYLTIRGEDRNRVILDGEFMLENGIQIYDTNGVSVENLTVRNFSLNGVYWNGSLGYRGSYLTVHNNGDYGVYAFNSVDGIFDNIYASGHPDSGIYIGQCYPCNAVISNSLVEGNALGYSGTNAGGHLYIIDNIWRDNMAGVVPNTLDSELNPPGRETTIVGNIVLNNNNKDAPSNRFGLVAYGMGMVVPGRVGDIVEKNLIVNHAKYGIVASPMLDANLYFSQHVKIKNNIVLDSGYADLKLAGPWGPGNCFQGNIYQTSEPPLLEQVHNCSNVNGSILSRLPMQGDVSGLMMLAGLFADAAGVKPPKAKYKDYPWPEDQVNMPNAGNSTPSPAINVFFIPDLSKIGLPNIELAIVGADKEIVMSGIPISSPTLWQLMFQVYGYFMPFVLFAAWSAMALWDVNTNEKTQGRNRYMWLFIIFLIPFFGVIYYHLFGPSKISRSMKVAAIGGGLLSYLIILILSAVISGLV